MKACRFHWYHVQKHPRDILTPDHPCDLGTTTRQRLIPEHSPACKHHLYRCLTSRSTSRNLKMFPIPWPHLSILFLPATEKQDAFIRRQQESAFCGLLRPIVVEPSTESGTQRFAIDGAEDLHLLRSGQIPQNQGSNSEATREGKREEEA